jgi:hypothetical protein
MSAATCCSALQATKASRTTVDTVPVCSIDQADYENSEKIAQSPLAYEGFGPSVSMFVLFWVATFTMAHA